MRNNELRAMLARDHMAFSPSDRARARLREEMARKNLNQTDIANLLKWTESRVSKVLTGRTELGVDDLGELCWSVGITLTEATRDHGLEFCAEMTPTELRVLENLRRLAPAERDAYVLMLKARASDLPDRHARPLKKSLMHKNR